MRPHWRIRRLEEADVRRLMRGHDLPEVVARLLVARGHTDSEAVAGHLRASPMSLGDPLLLPNMEAAVERVTRAIREGEKILIHGDYDVDGVTGTALLTRLLRGLGAQTAWHLPDRLRHGYSFGDHSIEKALAEEARLVISVDNGTSAHEVIAKLAEHGIDTVVTDHHEPSAEALPAAVAIVNPKLADARQPRSEISGAAVAFKLAWGVAQRLDGAKRVRPEVKGLLEETMALVAIATVCDVVPLVDENRVFVRTGLRMLETAQSAGLRALLSVAGLSGRLPTAEDVGFQIGPRINACGRLGRADLAVELLLSEDEERAREIARELDEQNLRRREIESELAAEARAQAHERAGDAALVLAGRGWHPGVVGIVASRIAEEFDRPALVIGVEDGRGRGSGRTARGVDLLELMQAAAPHFTRFGGHAQAAGCELREEDIDAVREAMCARAREVLEDTGESEGELLIDYELPFPELTPLLMRHIDRLEPFGAQNAKPVLLSRDLRLARPPREVGSDGTHLMLQLRQGTQVLKAMAFGMGSRSGELAMGAPIAAVYTPRWNTFRGQTALEIQLHDFQVGP